MSIKSSIGVAIAFILGVWSTIHPAVKLLLALMVLDIAAGVMSAWIRKVLSSQVSYQGMLKKSLMLICVAAAHLVTDYFHMTLDLGAACAGFFAVNELISIAENCTEAGVPIPSKFAGVLKIVSSSEDKHKQ